METFNISKITTLTEDQLRQIGRIWDNEFPEKINGEFLWWLKRLEEVCHYIIEDEYGKVIAWSMVFNREENNLLIFIVIREYQRKGLGSKMMELMKSDYPVLHGWAIDHDRDKRKDGTQYPSPVNFFVKHGFKIDRDMEYNKTRRIMAVKINWMKNQSK